MNVLQQQHPTASPSQQSAELCLDAVSMKQRRAAPTLAVFRRSPEVTGGSVTIALLPGVPDAVCGVSVGDEDH